MCDRSHCSDPAKWSLSMKSTTYVLNVCKRCLVELVADLDSELKDKLVKQPLPGPSELKS